MIKFQWLIKGRTMHMSKFTVRWLYYTGHELSSDRSKALPYPSREEASYEMDKLQGYNPHTEFKLLPVVRRTK
jgi:hypothetical protein